MRVKKLFVVNDIVAVKLSLSRVVESQETSRSVLDFKEAPLIFDFSNHFLNRRTILRNPNLILFLLVVLFLIDSSSLDQEDCPVVSVSVFSVITCVFVLQDLDDTLIVKDDLLFEVKLA